jgi:hypothetical protein
MDARSALIAQPLGNYRLSARAASQGAWSLHLSTEQGPLRASGQGRWHPQQGLFIDVTLQPPGSRGERYAPALDLIARRQADGSYRLQWRS